MSKRTVAIVVVSVIVFVGTAEVVALFSHYVETGTLFYLHRQTHDLIQETAEGKLTGEGLHPYFGQTHVPGVAFEIPPSLQDAGRPAHLTNNNFGFVSPYRYPYAKARREQFVIGLFGGSVGLWFCQIGAHRLVEDLQRSAIFKDKERLNRLAARMRTTRLASVSFVLDRIYKRTLNDYYAELGRFANLKSNPRGNSLILPTARVKDDDAAAVFADIAHNWATSSLLMNQMLAQRGVPYVHFLQPNQYYGTRAFGAEEAKTALSADSPFKRSAEQGYPALEREAASLAGVRFFSGVHAFDDDRAAMYMDNCCHYTLAGNYRLADFMATRILASFKGPS